MERPEPYKSGILSTNNSAQMRQLLQDVYHHISRNVQKDVEVKITYDYSATDADGTAQEASGSASFTNID